MFAWCETHLHEYPSMDAAAEAVAGKLVPVAFRTARSWIGEYRSTGAVRAQTVVRPRTVCARTSSPSSRVRVVTIQWRHVQQHPKGCKHAANHLSASCRQV